MAKKYRSEGDTLRLVARCCENSAVMLEMAERDKPALNKANCGQAELLRQSAKILRELAGDTPANHGLFGDHSQMDLQDRKDV